MFYSIVKKPTSLLSLLPVAIILILTALVSYLLTPIYPYLTIFIAAIGIVSAIYLLPRLMNVEYEYSVEGDIFTVSLIRNKSARKILFSCDIAHLSSCAPTAEFEKVSADKTVKINFGENTSYTLLFSEDETKTLVIISPDEEFIKSLHLIAPRKVKCNILH